MAKQINQDGTEIEHQELEFSEIAEIVEGFVTYIFLGDNVIACNEEAELEGLKINEKASLIVLQWGIEQYGEEAMKENPPSSTLGNIVYGTREELLS